VTSVATDGGDAYSQGLSECWKAKEVKTSDLGTWMPSIYLVL
jgi:hypothetical protein